MRSKNLRRYYQILGVSEDASWSEIRQAYVRLVLRGHPDHGGTVQYFMELQEAYEALRDKHWRETHDAEPAPPPEPPSVTKEKPISPAVHWRPEYSWGAAKVRRWPSLVSSLAATFLATVVVIALIAPAQRRSQAGPVAPAVMSTCPTGVPRITIDQVAAMANGTLVRGTIINTTNAPITVEQLGFYQNGYRADQPPDWIDDPSEMDTSANPGNIAPGHVVQWTEIGPQVKGHIAVTAVATFPRAPDMPATANWSWPGADPNCQPP